MNIMIKILRERRTIVPSLSGASAARKNQRPMVRPLTCSDIAMVRHDAAAVCIGCAPPISITTNKKVGDHN